MYLHSPAVQVGRLALVACTFREVEFQARRHIDGVKTMVR